MKKIAVTHSMPNIEVATNPEESRNRALTRMMEQLKTMTLDYAYEERRTEWTVEFRACFYVTTEEHFNQAVHNEAMRIVNHMKPKDLS
jgi:hypothetical protein